MGVSPGMSEVLTISQTGELCPQRCWSPIPEFSWRSERCLSSEWNHHISDLQNSQFYARSYINRSDENVLVMELSLMVSVRGVMTRSIVDILSELCSPFLKGGNSAFITAIASSLFPQTEYR